MRGSRVLVLWLLGLHGCVWEHKNVHATKRTNKQEVSSRQLPTFVVAHVNNAKWTVSRNLRLTVRLVRSISPGNSAASS